MSHKVGHVVSCTAQTVQGSKYDTVGGPSWELKKKYF